MAAEEQNSQDNMWPVPKFYFAVEFGTGTDIAEACFQEVSGLDFESQIIEYRAGNAPRFNTAKMPGLVKSGSVTMKKGIFKDDDYFWEWYSQVKMNTIDRTTVRIKLLDEAEVPHMTWVLEHAWLTKITSSDLRANTNEIAVETIEIVYESLSIDDKGSLNS